MKQPLTAFLALVYCAILASFPLLADDQEELIIQLKTDDFELAETDIGALAVGESKTIETESGRVVDILRTADGAEIYVDGELLDLHMDHEGVHEMTQRVEIICEDEGNCEKNVFVVNAHDSDDASWISEDGQDLHQLHEGKEGQKVIVIRKEILKQD